ncbi:hypothetical protein SME22J_09290 [Serratia marcescens]|nr:hypothetical protein SME22J_09290 [Serratia marcescens]BEO41565.1 hypothetical protein SMQE13_09160 [Serratia marcescens]
MISRIYATAGRIPLLRSKCWPFGRIFPVFASAFQGEKGQYELAYLKSYYRREGYDYIHENGFQSCFGDQDAACLLTNGTDYSLADENDRMDVFAHGNEEGMYSLTLGEFAQYLREKGLSHIGVIKFNVCRSGFDQDFLLHARCVFQQAGISFAWMAAARDTINYCPPFKYISNHLFDENRYRVLPGNINKVFPGTRYTHAHIS